MTNVPGSIPGSFPGPFDEEAFLSQQTDQEGSTTIIPVPAGTFISRIGDVKPRPWSSEKTGKSGMSLDITFEIIDDGDYIAAQIGRPPKITQGYFCDLTPDNKLDFGAGKNVQLNRLREALGQNIAGQLWTPAMLRGAGPVSIVVIQDPDKNDRSIIYNRIKAVGRPS